MTESNFRVNLSQFEGPLDLLLFVVKKNQVDIKNLLVSKIIDQYLKYIEESDIENLSEQGYYLFIAARLINLKARKIYNDNTRVEDDEDEFTEEQFLDMLENYQLIKDSVDYFIGKRPRVYWDHFISGQAQEKVSDLPTQEIVQLMNAVQRIIVKSKKPFNEKVLDKSAVNIKKRINILIDMLKIGEPKWFNDLLSEKLGLIEIIETFLSILELLKRGAVQVIQENPNDDILVKPTKKIKKCTGILNPVL